MSCKLTVVLALAPVLVACGSGSIESSGIPADAQARYIGLLSVSRDNSQADALTNLDAQFMKLSESISVSELRREFVAQTERCEVLPLHNATSRSVDGPGTGEPFESVTPEPVSAGDTLVLESNSAQYAILHREPDRSYSQAHDVSGEIPGDLSVDIPGDEFPALAGVIFPDTPGLVVSTPLNIQQASVDQPLQWNGTGSADSMIDIGIMVRDADTQEQKVIYCLAKDDGQFELPSQIQAEFVSEPEVQFLLMVRYSFSFSYNQGALVLAKISPEPYVIGEANYILSSPTDKDLWTPAHHGAFRF